MAGAAPVLVVDLCDSESEEAACAEQPRSSKRHREEAHAPSAPSEVIDLTANDVSEAFRQWELIDLTAEEPAKELPAIVDELAKERSRIHAFLAAKATVLRVEACKPNPHSLPGTKLYERFVAARKRCADKTVQLVFHGTPEANVEPICRDGLDAGRRGRTGQAMGAGEYFGKSALISVSFCQGARKMLVFAVLRDSSGITADTGEVLVVHNVQHQLPLFVISFKAVDKEDLIEGLMQSMPPAPRAMCRAVATMLLDLGPLGKLGPPPPPVFRPFTGTGTALGGSAPPASSALGGVRHILERAAAAERCALCASSLTPGELVLSRGTGIDVRLHHLRCAASARWAAEVPLQPLLRTMGALSQLELACVYEQLGSDAQRAAGRGAHK